MNTTERKDRILVVDDEQPVLDVLDAMLCDDYIVDTARDGAEALKLCRQHKYPAMIIDIALPGRLNGFELVDALREVAPDAKFIMITGLALNDADKQKALAVADALLMKPFDVDAIKALLRKDLRLAHMPHGG